MNRCCPAMAIDDNLVNEESNFDGKGTEEGGLGLGVGFFEALLVSWKGFGGSHWVLGYGEVRISLLGGADGCPYLWCR